MARGRTRTVELVDDDEPGGPGAPTGPGTLTGPGAPTGAPTPPGPARRRAVVTCAVVLVVLVVVAVMGQARQAAAERARLARVAALPNTVTSLENPPHALWSTDGEVLQRVGARTPDGLLVGTREDDDGSSHAQAVDPATGDVVWERELLPPATSPEESPEESYRVGASCVGTGDDVTRVACYASDATYRLDGSAVRYEPATTVRLLLLDAGDGTVVADASDLPAGDGTRASLDALGDLVVLTEVTGEEARVLAVRADGRVAWRTTVPAPVPVPSPDGPSDPFADVVPLGEHLLVVTSDAAHVLARTGTTLRTFPLGPDERVTGVVGGVAVARTGPVRAEIERVDGETVVRGEGTRVLGLDGEHVLRGTLVRAEVDDASAPGLVLTRDHEGLHGWGLDGALRWTAALEGQPTAAAVLDGRVHVLGSRAVTTFDARTGEELWRHDDVGVEQPVVTDGRRLVVQAESPDGERTDLLALDAVDGAVVWRVPGPDELALLRALHGTLVAESYGWTDDTWSMTVMG